MKEILIDFPLTHAVDHINIPVVDFEFFTSNFCFQIIILRVKTLLI